MAAGHRLRLAAQRARKRPASELPHGAEAVVDPKNFRVSDVAGDGRSKSAASAVREAAVRADRARGKLRKK